MPQSIRYTKLTQAVRRLRNALLPATFNTTGSYRSPERTHLRAVSFRVLVHAEIESYLEDRAFELFKLGWDEWCASKTPSDVIVGVLGFSGTVTVSPPAKLGGDPARQTSYDSLHVPIAKAQGVWRAAHKENNGIKEANVLALLLPLGVKSDELDTVLLADLSSYGVARGEAVHRSSVGASVNADPKTELDRAEQLIRDLTSIDALISRACRRVKNHGIAARKA